MYDPKEVFDRLNALPDRLNGVLMMLRATERIQQENHEKLMKAIADDDFEQVSICAAKLESIGAQVRFEKQLVRDIMDEGRKLYLVAFGPQGAMLWDNMINSIGS